MRVKVSSKYQVVIPKEVRSSLGLIPGTFVDVIAKGGIAYIVPVKCLEDARGLLKGKLFADDVKNFRSKRDKRD